MPFRYTITLLQSFLVRYIGYWKLDLFSQCVSINREFRLTRPRPAKHQMSTTLHGVCTACFCCLIRWCKSWIVNRACPPVSTKPVFIEQAAGTGASGKTAASDSSLYAARKEDKKQECIRSTCYIWLHTGQHGSLRDSLPFPASESSHGHGRKAGSLQLSHV
jgi:hypothetical protein